MIKQKNIETRHFQEYKFVYRVGMTHIVFNLQLWSDWRVEEYCTDLKHPVSFDFYVFKFKNLNLNIPKDQITDFRRTWKWDLEIDNFIFNKLQCPTRAKIMLRREVKKQKRKRDICKTIKRVFFEYLFTDFKRSKK